MGKFFIIQGLVTLKRMIPSGPNSNLSRDFMPLLDTCKFEEVVIKTEGAMPRTMSNMFFYHSRASNSKKSCTIWLKFKLVRDFMPVLVIRKLIKFQWKKKLLCLGQHFPHYKSMGKFFIAQGRVTLKRMIQSGPNSNLSEIFCLSWTPASLKEL